MESPARRRPGPLTLLPPRLTALPSGTCKRSSSCTSPARTARASPLRSPRVLAQHDIQILDINQTVIHRTLLMGMLVRIPPQVESTNVLKDLLFTAHHAGLRLRMTPVEDEEYDAWVGREGKPRYILTLLARELHAGARGGRVEADRRAGAEHRHHHPPVGPAAAGRRRRREQAGDARPAAGVRGVFRPRPAARRGRAAGGADGDHPGPPRRHRLAARQRLPPDAPAGRVRHGLDPHPARGDRRTGPRGRRVRRGRRPSPNRPCAASWISARRSPAGWRC